MDSLPSFQIAIDGPAASGKSTVAKLLAQRLGGHYLSTGDLYRALSWKALSRNLQPETQPDQVVEMLQDTTLAYQLKEGAPVLFLDGREVNLPELHAPRVAAVVSHVAKIPALREWLLQVQRDCRNLGIVIMEGRDIGTVIFPQAKFKFFVTATPLERARRRLAQKGEVPQGATLESVAADIARRDELDSTRKTAPLRPAEDAVLIQTDGMTPDQVADKLAGLVRQGS
ncbi:MAG: (d)CMP kinase [Oligosphaeraceae bacterium]